MINKALRLIRQFHEVKQTDLAKQLNISKSYLSEIESGKKTVSFELLQKYSQIFEIQTSSLVFFSECISSKNKFSEKFRSNFAGKLLNIMEWVVNGNENKNSKAKNSNE
ncbi:MAG: helix-turn-helix transcriptional regulator [Oceanospirillaceae bacterium]